LSERPQVRVASSGAFTPELAEHIEPLTNRVDLFSEIENHLIQNLMALSHQFDFATGGGVFQPESRKMNWVWHSKSAH
jgi:hypothetical protein